MICSSSFSHPKATWFGVLFHTPKPILPTNTSGSGRLKWTSYFRLKWSMISRATSTCWIWSSPTGTSVLRIRTEWYALRCTSWYRRSLRLGRKEDPADWQTHPPCCQALRFCLWIGACVEGDWYWCCFPKSNPIHSGKHSTEQNNEIVTSDWTNRTELSLGSRPQAKRELKEFLPFTIRSACLQNVFLQFLWVGNRSKSMITHNSEIALLIV